MIAQAGEARRGETPLGGSTAQRDHATAKPMRPDLEARILDLLAANNREVELRRQANHERDLSQSMLRATGRALMKAEEDRDSARAMLGEALAELAELRGRNA